jgi:hypothetical protein
MIPRVSLWLGCIALTAIGCGKDSEAPFGVDAAVDDQCIQAIAKAEYLVEPGVPALSGLLTRSPRRGRRQLDGRAVLVGQPRRALQRDLW